LLAEDNEINQQFAREILEAEGCNVDLAPDGRKALILATSQTYDLVFMDCEMPELDGLTVTRSIREYERQHAKKPMPIIALTAHAMAGDREKCIAAGMDDYLTKPLRRQQLRDTLARWMNTKT
jgi:CheY-like chemotaxis protein